MQLHFYHHWIAQYFDSDKKNGNYINGISSKIESVPLSVRPPCVRLLVVWLVGRSVLKRAGIYTSMLLSESIPLYSRNSWLCFDNGRPCKSLFLGWRSMFWHWCLFLAFAETILLYCIILLKGEQKILKYFVLIHWCLHLSGNSSSSSKNVSNSVFWIPFIILYV